MEKENSDKTFPISINQNSALSDDQIINNFRENIRWASGIFSLFFLYFAIMILVFQRDIIIKILSFLELANLIIHLSFLIEKYSLTALFTVVIALITGLYLYFRFFSNIRHNDFSGEMRYFLQFYEILVSLTFEITILLILFFYLILIKNSWSEFFIAFFVIIGINYSIRLISIHYSKILTQYSLIEKFQNDLNKISKNAGNPSFIFENKLKDYIIQIFFNSNSSLVTITLFLTILIAIYGFAWNFNVITILFLEIIIIRYGLIQSQVGSLPKTAINLYLMNGDSFIRVFRIKENNDIFLILNQENTLQIIPKRNVKIFEEVKPQINL